MEKVNKRGKKPDKHGDKEEYKSMYMKKPAIQIFFS